MSTQGEGEIPRDEVEAVLEARRELGPSYDAALVDSFADRIEQAVAARVEHAAQGSTRAEQELAAAGKRAFALGVVSLGTGIPITAIAQLEGIAGVIVAWVGIVGVNVAHSISVSGLRGNVRRHPG